MNEPTSESPAGPPDGRPFGIRPCQISEIDTILRFWVESEAIMNVTDDYTGVLRLLQHDPNALLLAEVEGKIVGTVIAVFDGWRGNLYHAAVNPSMRRHGIGAALVAAGEAHLRNLGARRVSVLATATRESAVGFWQAMGYKHDPRAARAAKNLAPSTPV